MKPTLDRLVDLIRAHPTMTGKELARSLGYAEPRSLYHWLQKAGYSGLRPFRNAVLRGEYPPFALPPTHVRLAETSSQPQQIEGFSESGDLLLADDPINWPGNADFSLRWEGADVQPLVAHGDWLLLQRPEDLADGDWLVLRRGDGTLHIGRLITIGAERAVVQPPLGEVWHGPLPQVVARIVGLLRLFR